MKEFQKALFLFRRDLRLNDNTALINALVRSKTVITAFIFTPEQIRKNPYRSDRCVQFMIESLIELAKELHQKSGRLCLFEGPYDAIVSRCIDELKIDAIFVNRDYTPYSQKRDLKLNQLCKRYNIPFFSYDDSLLNRPENLLKADGKPYTIFTPYFKKASTIEVGRPQPNTHTNYNSSIIKFAKNVSFLDSLLPKNASHQIITGSRSACLHILQDLRSFRAYAKLRDFPAEQGCTHLSAYLKFNLCSIREIYHAIREELGKHSELLRSLYWRDFFSQIALFFPHVFQGAYRPQFDRIKWSYDKKAFRLWCEGNTGFPIVDAGMRELNATGFMHNRVRMIAGSFLIKDLHIDWRWGEKYFAQKLIDYDPSLNNGNWQWIAGTGTDAQPYFRIFNPWNQQKKFDPNCVYIKTWIPELQTANSKQIHNRHSTTSNDDYPPPMLDHTAEAKKALAQYRRAMPRAKKA